MNSKGNMTAVDWFYQRILAKDIQSVFEQAKQMEKDQIMDAYNQGCNDYDELGYKRIEQYYNETFKSKHDETE